MWLVSGHVCIFIVIPEHAWLYFNVSIFDFKKFCSEENVWKLCDTIRKDFPSELDYCHVAFISNPKRMVPMWRQKSGKNEEKLALWV